jgi:putative membrane protein
MSNLTDPRVLFAAERTLLAWNRTSISFMAFGFVVERFGLFINIMGKEEAKFLQREISFYLGMVFVILAILISFISIYQYKNIMLSLTKDEIPKGYNIWLTAKVNGVVGVLGIILIYYLYQGF